MIETVCGSLIYLGSAIFLASCHSGIQRWLKRVRKKKLEHEINEIISELEVHREAVLYIRMANDYLCKLDEQEIKFHFNFWKGLDDYNSFMRTNKRLIYEYERMEYEVGEFLRDQNHENIKSVKCNLDNFSFRSMIQVVKMDKFFHELRKNK
jgi:hypothetical protein